MCIRDSFDKLAEGVVKFSSRVLCIDANMALWCVVPELRARGLMISMAAFSPFYHSPDKKNAKMDSLGIFVIGPTLSIRMAFCPTLVGDVPAPKRRDEDRLVQKEVQTGHGYKRRFVPHDAVSFAKGQ